MLQLITAIFTTADEVSQHLLHNIIYFLCCPAIQRSRPLLMDAYIFIRALICFMALKKRYNKWMYVLGLIVYIGYAIYLLIDKSGVLSWINEHDAENIVQSMKATKLGIEEPREFFGLLLLVIALVTNMIAEKKHNTNDGIT